MDDKEKRLSEILNTQRTPEQAQACYAKIQERLAQEKARKKLVLKRVVACAASLILVCAAVLVPLLLKKEEVRYYDDNLILENSVREEVEAGLDNLDVAIPAFESSAVLSYRVYKPKDGDLVVGARFGFECLTDTNYYDGIVMLYDDSVVLDLTDYDGMEQTIEFDGITYKYELTSMRDDMFNYQAYAVTDDFTIIIDYRAFVDEFATFIDQLY